MSSKSMFFIFGILFWVWLNVNKLLKWYTTMSIVLMTVNVMTLSKTVKVYMFYL